MLKTLVFPCELWVISVCLVSGCAKQDPEILFGQAVVNAASAHWDEALADSESTLRLDSSHLAARILKGLCLHHLQEPEKAMETLRAAAQDAPNDFAAQYFYGWIMCESERYQDALPALRKAHELRPENDHATALLARCCLEQSLPEEGIELFTALRKNPSYGIGAVVDNSLALLYLYQGDMVKARNHLFAALRREPDNPVIAQNIAVLYDQYLASPREALRYYVVARNNSQKIGDKKRVAVLGRRIAAVAREM